MKIYDEGAEALHEILTAASAEQGATLLVPDLQRPYVWSPTQVILLVDSLLRGWPFGTLLLWSVHKEELASIPSRTFWRVADRTGQFDDGPMTKSNPPAQFRMVLDGQQRLQSLLLALGGDSWGFRLLDREWSAALNAESPRGRNATRHWSLGHLCLDLHAFRDLLKTNGNVARVDFSQVLSWVVQSPSDGRSAIKKPANYKHPIPSALEERGRYLRLSRLWEVASPNPGLFEKHFRLKLEPLLREHEVAQDVIDGTLGHLAELAVTLAAIKQSKVSYLVLSPFDPDAWDHDVYNDAIVNVFTRLNTAGRVLTRQEITFAWVKNGWDPSNTEGRTAGRCFEELREELEGEGVPLDIDSLVGAVSAMWSVLHRQGVLLTANDLLKGDKVRPMAADIAGNWSLLASNAVDTARLIGDRGFVYRTHYRSMNVIVLLFCWRLLGRQWLDAHSLSVTERDSFEKSLDSKLWSVSDQWIVLSQWSGKWGKSTDRAFAEYIKELSEDWRCVASLSSAAGVIDVLSARIEGWIESLKAESLKYIDDLAVLTREAVHQYYLPLWLWHRLDDERWKASSVPLRESKRKTIRLEVDHIVAVKLWDSLQSQSAPQDSDAQEQQESEVMSAMNALGNCCLLEKSFNIAKSAEPMRGFLNRVHEFKEGKFQTSTWAGALDMDEVLLDPTGSNADEVSDAVLRRTESMKAELREYVAGRRHRVDV